jgi:polar amino acid transport system substrate-binding protein
VPSRCSAPLRLCVFLLPALALASAAHAADDSAGRASSPAASTIDSLARVKRAGVLRWGGDVQGGEPYVFEDPRQPGTLVGFEVEIAAGLARQLGVRPEFVQNDWSMLVPTLERGTVDVALNGLEVTEARRQRIRFTRPYFVFAERLSVRAGERRVSTLASLRGLRAGTLTNTLAWDLLGQVGAVRLPYEGVAEPYRDLAAGRLDAVLMDDIIADRYGRLPGLTVVADVAQGQYAIGVRPADQELAAALDQALGRLVASGELRAILRRWRLDGPRQDALLSAAPARAAEITAAGPPATRAGRLTARQVVLFLQGAAITLALSAGAMAIAMSLGLLLALARLPARVRWRRALAVGAAVYVELFRGTPLLLQLYLLYFGLAPFYPLHPVAAAIVGLGLNYGAYEAEIYRAGLQAVPTGQIEAAEALGMPGATVVRRVVLPQAFRFSLPGVANDFIALLKDSSLVSVITVVELTKRMNIAAVDSGGWLLPGLLCAGLYLSMSYPLSRLARRLERKLGPRP